MDKTAPVITLDGLSGAGKGTLGLRVSRALSWHYLDSGIFYRLLAFEATRQLVAVDDEKSLAEIAFTLHPTLQIEELSKDALQLNILWREENITYALRTEHCGFIASQIANYPTVRKALLEVQRSFQKRPGLIADGRDMGEIVFPGAVCKFFLTASIETRVQRRQEQLKQQGNYASLTAVKNAIVQRDQSDKTRLEATLKTIPKACIIDTTSLSVTQVVALIENQLSTIGLYFH